VALEGSAKDLLLDPQVSELYLGGLPASSPEVETVVQGIA
jgi:hypothetical protein